MEHARFWSLIDSARAARGRTSAALVKALAQLPPDQIVSFDAWFWAYYLAAQREDLWAAVYAIRGGCSDDSFDYFRGWLISRGEAAFLGAIRDPESLAVIIGDADPRDELMLGAARNAHERATGHELPKTHVDIAIPGRSQWPADRIPSGAKWNDAFYAAHYPKLYARYIEPNKRDEPTGAIAHDRFWDMIETARDGATTTDAAVQKLAASLHQLSIPDLIGFDRWLAAYNQALIRNELKTVCRLVLGKDDHDTVPGFRGWLIAQGRAAVHAAAYEPDAILAHAKHPPAACVAMIFITQNTFRAHNMYRGFVDEDEREAIPDRNSWPADPPNASPSIDELRARFPRLTADRTDKQLGGKIDVSRLSDFERQRVAEDLVHRAKSISDDRAKLELLDLAVEACPHDLASRAARGRVHARLANHDAALADFNAALASRPDAVIVAWDRAKVRAARGDHKGAVEDARRAASDVAEARTWLAAQMPGTPRRVRHAKFGEGTVVSAETTGNEPKLVIDFAVGRKTIAKRFVDVIE